MHFFGPSPVTKSCSVCVLAGVCVFTSGVIESASASLGVAGSWIHRCLMAYPCFVEYIYGHGNALCYFETVIFLQIIVIVNIVDILLIYTYMLLRVRHLLIHSHLPHTHSYVLDEATANV